MIKQVLLLAASTFCSSAANAQYDTLWIGTADGPSTSLDNTPFPTGEARTARTQYLVHSSVLQQLDLFPNPVIYGICLQVVDDDIIDPACLVNLHTQMKNEATNDLTDFIYSGLVPTGTSSGVNLSAGVLGIPSTTSPWYWMGAGNNMIIEINYERGEDAGLSPRIMLDMDLGYTATYTGRTDAVMSGQDIASPDPGVVMGSDNSLPVLGLLVDASTGTKERAGSARVRVFPNPASSILDVRVPFGTASIRITAICGRTVLQRPFTSVTGKLDVSLLPSGCYVLNTLSEHGTTASSRFIKE